MLRSFLIFAAVLFSTVTMLAQEDSFPTGDSVEVFVVESYILPENPDTLLLTFFTSDFAKSYLLIGQDKILISPQPLDRHEAKIGIKNYKDGKPQIVCYILTETEDGKTSHSDPLQLDIPQEYRFSENTGSLFGCLIGGVVFAAPNLGVAFRGKESGFSVGKEIPFLTFYVSENHYPFGYISAEYQYITKPNRNIFRVGYKHIIDIPVLAYISPGITGFTDFLGTAGAGVEMNLGLFTISNVFTVNLRGRVNAAPQKQPFWEVGVNVFSSFFTFRL